MPLPVFCAGRGGVRYAPCPAFPLRRPEAEKNGDGEN